MKYSFLFSSLLGILLLCPVTAAAAARIQAPVLKVSRAENGTVTLNWGKVSQASTYNMQACVRDDFSSCYSLPFRAPQSSYTATSKNWPSNFTWYFRINACPIKTALCSAWSTTAVLPAKVDKVPPTVQFISPKAGQTVSGTVEFRVTLVDNLKGSGADRVEYYLDSAATPFLTSTYTPYYPMSLNTAKLAAGAHKITAKGFDKAGNFSDVSLSFTIANADTIAPSISWVLPTASQLLLEPTHLKVNAVDNIGGSGVDRVEFFLGGATVPFASSSVPPFSVLFDPRNVQDGNRELIAKAIDKSGNAATAVVDTVIKGEPRFSHSFESWVTPNFQGLIAVSATAEEIGTESANLVITGTSDTKSKFSVTIEARLAKGVNASWVLTNSRVEGLPTGFTAPVFDVENNLGNSFPKNKYIFIRSGNEKAYRMKWQVDGSATSMVRPLIVPRTTPTFAPQGTRKILAMKASLLDKIKDEGAFPYGPDVSKMLEPNFEDLREVIAKISENRLNLSYEFTDTVYHPTLYEVSDVTCSDSIPNPSEPGRFLNVNVDLMRGALDSLKQRVPNPIFDFYVYDMYTRSGELFRNGSCYRNEGGSFWGQCPECKRAVFQPGLSTDAHHGAFLHEFGHTLGLFHPRLNRFCRGATVGMIAEAELFYPCEKVGEPLAETMGNAYTASRSFSPLERAQLGWLRATQTVLVTGSGEFELYSDNDDRSVEWNKPILLQIVVQTASGYDYLYVFVPNIVSSNANWYVGDDSQTGSPDFYRKYFTSGIYLAAPGAGHRFGKGAMSSETIYFSARNHIDDEHSIGRAPLLPGESVKVQTGNTVVNITNVGRKGNRAQVKVTYETEAGK